VDALIEELRTRPPLRHHTPATAPPCQPRRGGGSIARGETPGWLVGRWNRPTGCTIYWPALLQGFTPGFDRRPSGAGQRSRGAFEETCPTLNPSSWPHSQEGQSFPGGPIGAAAATRPLQKAVLEMTPAQATQTVKDSGLRARGGAGLFPPD